MRKSPAELSSEEFRSIGHELVDRIAEFLDRLPEMRVAPQGAPRDMRRHIGGSAVPERGERPDAVARRAAELVIEHSTLNGHPRFFGYITASAAPLGALADLLASSVNPNCGAWALSPIATEVEKQSTRWIAQLIGFPEDAGGILVSGGNMANMVCLVAALRAQAGWDVRARGLGTGQRLRAYASAEVHTWLQKGADIFGLGTDAVRAVPVNDQLAMDVGALERMIAEDRRAGHQPVFVVGTAGSVSTGAVDPLPTIAALCKREKLWFHADGAYGAPAAVLPECSPDLRALSLADSVAVDPHKWLYTPLEAGCALVRNAEALHSAYSFHPTYYHFEGAADDPPTNFHEWGPQNSRGFRALKVWMTIQQVGREGYVQMIRDDIALAREMCDYASEHDELEVLTNALSITTFRYVPRELRSTRSQPATQERLNALNAAILERLQGGGVVYPSNAVIGGRFAIRACIVNFRTQSADVRALVDATVAAGRELT